MPTSSEQKALAFVAIVILLGGAVRVLRAGASPTPTRSEQQALARQATAADSASQGARRGKPAKRGRSSRPSRDTTPHVVGGVASVPPQFARPDFRCPRRGSTRTRSARARRGRAARPRVARGRRPASQSTSIVPRCARSRPCRASGQRSRTASSPTATRSAPSAPWRALVGSKESGQRFSSVWPRSSRLGGPLHHEHAHREHPPSLARSSSALFVHL